MMRASSRSSMRRISDAVASLTMPELPPGIQALAAILEEHKDQKRIMLVGHEPDFSHTISELIGGGVGLGTHRRDEQQRLLLPRDQRAH